MRLSAVLVCALVLCACTNESEPEVERTFAPRECFPPEGIGGAALTIEQTVDYINALPKPLSVPCFLQAMERPLELQATSGTFSLQPAYGKNNPRFLIYREELTLSVVPKGEGRPLIELSVRREPGRSLKGEFAFPIEAELPADAPYTRIRDESGTRCGFCHLTEEPAVDIDFAEAFVSSQIAPKPHELVDAEYLDWLWRSCDPSLEPDRCAVFDAIFAHGEVNVRPLE